jgi:2-polyprenyl-3-methyl-5-hydroxy-6-metoxy-1,4-benzoquinol methylase
MGAAYTRIRMIMEYFYTPAALPDDKLLLQEIQSAAGRLRQKLQRLQLSELGISEYNQRYLGAYIHNLRGSLQISSYILAWSLAHATSALHEFVFVDYGGGCGITSLLASELGVGTVIYNDIYDVSCQDAQLIGKTVNREAQAYVCGDIDELIEYLQSQSISIDAITSFDVIEHIYDIDEYFRKLRFLPSKALRVVFASSANIHNPVRKRRLMKSHHATERLDRERVWGHKERDSLRGYFSLRKDIIASFGSSLLPEEIDQLAHATRGLTKADIEECVMEYQQTGSISYRPDHPTNTCDPCTGNWDERLIDTHHIKAIFQREGFEVQIKNGFYACSQQLIKQLLAYVLNTMICLLKTKGIILAPSYMVYALAGSARPSGKVPHAY